LDEYFKTAFAIIPKPQGVESADDQLAEFQILQPDSPSLETKDTTYFEMVSISPVALRIDIKPTHIPTPTKNISLTLNKLILRNILGWNTSILIEAWAPGLKSSAPLQILKGLFEGTTHSIVHGMVGLLPNFVQKIGSLLWYKNVQK